MKKLFLIFAILSVLSLSVSAQWVNKLDYRGGRLHLFSPNYTTWVNNKSFISIGQNEHQTWPASQGLTAIDMFLPLILSGSNKYYVGQRISFDVQGTVTNPNVVGSQIAIYSNSLFPAGTGSLIGQSSSVDIGGPVSYAAGGTFGAATGSSGAAGTGTIVGIGATTSLHNAGATNVYGLDIWTTSSTSSPAAVAENVKGIRVRARANNGNTFNDLRFIDLGGSSKSGTGAVGYSYGLFIDDTINLGTINYTIHSTSTSPSLLAGDLSITNATKGIILKSPNGTCYRFTVADGGVLSAGASVVCP